VITRGEITSIRSPRVKAARQLAKRSFRQRARSFLAEGPQAVREALTSREISGPAAAPGGAGAGAVGSGPPVVTELFVTGAAWARHAELAE
jgi:RNA methyltransferase, TrmH family